MQDQFTDTLVSERVCLFCTSAGSRMELELPVRELQLSRAGVISLLAEETLQQSMSWINE